MRRGNRGYLVVLVGCPVAVHPRAAFYFCKRTLAIRRFSRCRSLVKWLPFVLDHTLSRIEVLIIMVVHYLINRSLVYLIVNSTAYHHLLNPIVNVIIFSTITRYFCCCLPLSLSSSLCRRFPFTFILSSLIAIVAKIMIFYCLQFFPRGERRAGTINFTTVKLSLLS